jgi:hypothetical protein
MEILLEILLDVIKGLAIYLTAKVLEDLLGELFRYLENYGTPQCA